MDLLNIILLSLVILDQANDGLCAVGTFNAALNKPTDQSSSPYPGKGDSKFAVDGNKNTAFAQKSCSHTAKDQNAWWAVDLLHIFRVKSVRITNRGDGVGYRLKDFSIWGSNQAINKTLRLCKEKRGSVGEAATEQFDCRDQSFYSRYIIIKLNNTGFLALCEVVVTAECLDGKYGENCGNNCSNTCLSTLSCDKKHGRCAECQSGYRGKECKKDCHNGTYGDRCKYNCSANCLEPVCDKFSTNGMCTGGQCKPGYMSANCSKECPDGTYGDRCKYNCSANCLQPLCDKFSTNGMCNKGQCKPGYMPGGNCTTVCPDGTYGDGCKYNCSVNCLEPECDKFSTNGMCNGGRCKPGYVYGGNCTMECANGTYGHNCTQQCSTNCQDSLCNHATGFCLNGCQKGFNGSTCSAECASGTYGDGCKYSCSANCLKPECDKFSTNGKCIGGECKPGYVYGGNCTTECVNGTYGKNCTKLCPTNCLDSLCNHAMGFCTNGCQKGFTGNTCSAVAGSSIPAVAGGVIGAIIIIVLVIILVVIILRKRKLLTDTSDQKEDDNLAMLSLSDKTGGNGKPHVAVEPIAPSRENETTNCIYENEKNVKLDKPLIAVKPMKQNETVKDSQEETGFETGEQNMIYANVQESATVIKIGELHTYISSEKNKKEPFQEAYERIPNKIYSCEKSEIPELKGKNRYKNIYPYDNNRVTLEQIGKDPLSTYINASYVKDYNGNISYIAALGTTAQTIPDFWRMIWENNVSLIVMVTNLVEQMKVKCEQYWPSSMNENLNIEGITISLEDEKSQPYYVVRTLKISKGGSRRVIEHYQYTAWPDKSVPDHLYSLCKIRNEMKIYRQQRKTPILVHCSAGVGRTGTIIALDILLDQADAEKSVDVYKCVEMLRSQRNNMVQTLVQYVFIHNALLEIVYVGSTPVPIQNFHSYFNSADGRMKIAKQFKTLEEIKPVYKEEEIILGKINNKDNRDNDIIPPDSHRVKLLNEPEVYINAVYVPSFSQKFSYIATQLPLPNTAVTFWSMIQDLNCTQLICLEDDPQYKEWFSREKGSITLDQWNVITVGKKVNSMVTVYEILIGKDSESMYANVGTQETDFQGGCRLQLYMLPHWSRKSLKERDIGSLLASINDLKKQTETELCTVICRNGATECGLYIASSWILDMVNEQEQVDIFNVVKQIKKRRPHFISNKDQYSFLHSLVEEQITVTDDCQEYATVVKKQK